jgi:hypothetical protein
MRMLQRIHLLKCSLTKRFSSRLLFADKNDFLIGTKGSLIHTNNSVTARRSNIVPHSISGSVIFLKPDADTYTFCFSVYTDSYLVRL